MAWVGIVGGLGVGATVHYYEKITAACKARGVMPDLGIVHADVDEGQGFVREGRLDALADYLAGFIERLGRAGAQAAVLPAVTPHICISRTDVAHQTAADQHRRRHRRGASQARSSSAWRCSARPSPCKAACGASSPAWRS